VQEYLQSGQAFVDTLMALPIRDLTNGMRIIEGMPNLTATASMNLIVHEVTEPFWQE
jgi:hypothetical protein